MSMNIIAGYRGEPHITSQQLRNKNIGIFGDDVCILAVGSEMAATVISANEVDIADGILVAEGCTAEITHGTVEAMAIDNGAQGMLRTDLIVARYTKNSGTGVEDMQLEVIKGTPAASNPATPSHTTGSIADGDTTVDFPLYEVHLDGISIDSVECLVDTVSLVKSSVVSALQTDVTNIANNIGSVAMGTTATTVTGAIKELVNKIGSVAMGTTATTITGAIKELLTSINGVKGRTTTLETKTQGISGTRQYTANANDSVYVNLEASSVYLIIVSGWTTSTSVTGMYVIGSTTGADLGIKAISAASSVALSDTGNAGILKVQNNGNVTLRVTVITLSGSVPL